MIFIFGISPIEKDFGPCDEITCPHCNNRRFWNLKRTTQFISFFFIPIIPTSVKRFLQCPICLVSQPLSKEEFEQKRQQADLNRDVINKNISEQEYHERKSQF